MHLLLNAYDIRNLDKFFLSELDEARNEQKNASSRDVNYFFNQHLIEENAYFIRFPQSRGPLVQACRKQLIILIITTFQTGCGTVVPS